MKTPKRNTPTQSSNSGVLCASCVSACVRACDTGENSPLPEAEVKQPRVAVGATEGEALDGHAVLRRGVSHMSLPVRQRLLESSSNKHKTTTPTNARKQQQENNNKKASRFSSKTMSVLWWNPIKKRWEDHLACQFGAHFHNYLSGQQGIKARIPHNTVTPRNQTNNILARLPLPASKAGTHTIIHDTTIASPHST